MLGGAALLGVVALALSHKVLHDHMAQLDAAERAAHKMVKVVVASRDVARGEPITADRFAVREVPVEYVHSAAIRPDHFSRYTGLRLGAALKRGETLLDVHLESTSLVFSSTLENGNRALTTEVDEVNSISGMLRPGDHIDLMATARGSGSKTTSDTTFPLLSNVEVLATGQVTRKADGSTQAHTYTTITLSVSPQDAQRVVVAKNSGKLTAVLRNPDDAQAGVTSAMNIDDVLPKKPADAKRIAVQYIVGGGGRS
ncbi:MAG TPA: Flp pilus assembly protein CpaB [Steroidobacteraceae bacterium]|nr:Flp pilus assembly protein CpaB [Steroidobacteraceae bacterium]